MTTQEADSAQSEREEPSSYTRLPRTEEDGPSKRAELKRAIEHGAGEVAAVIGKGMRRASEMVGAPSSTELDSLSSDTDLPELGSADTLSALALRLDHEADLWRALALKAMSRAAWADRTGHGMSVVAAVGCVALAGIAGMQALFGGASWQKAAMIAAGFLALVAGHLVVSATGAAIRKAQREIAREALSRADVAELRLHRIAVVLTVRGDERAAYGEALKRLEREVSTPAR